MHENASQHAEAWDWLAVAIRAAHVAVGVSRLGDGAFVEVNDAFCRLFQARREQIIGRSSAQLGIWPVPAQRERMVGLLRQNGRVVGYEARFRTLQGEEGDLEISAQIIDRDGQPHLVGFLSDITDRREMVEGLRLAQGRLGLVLRSSKVLVLRQDRDMRITWIANPALGATESAMLGRTDAEIMGAEAAAPLLAIKRRVLETGVPERQDVWVAYEETGQRGCFDLVVEPERDAAGRITGIVCAAQDVTWRMPPPPGAAPPPAAAAPPAPPATAALDAGAIGTLAGPARAIQGLAALIGQEPLSTYQGQRLARIAGEAQHVSSLVASVLDLGRIEHGTLELLPAELDLRTFMDETLRLARHRAVARAGDLALAGPVPDEALAGDSARLRLALLSGVELALGLSGRGPVTLAARVAESRAADVLLHFDVTPAGPAPAPEVLARLQQRGPHGGGGAAELPEPLQLALRVMHQLAQAMGGQAGLEIGTGGSTEGRSRVWFSARLARAAPPPGHEWPRVDDGARVALQRRHAGTLVLVADHNPIVRQLFVELLEHAGLRVMQATNGVEAFSLAVQHQPALVLLDMELPQRGGVAAARAMRAMLAQRVPLVALAAETPLDASGLMLEADLDDLLLKPVVSDLFYAKVLAWLEP